MVSDPSIRAHSTKKRPGPSRPLRIAAAMPGAISPLPAARAADHPTMAFATHGSDGSDGKKRNRIPRRRKTKVVKSAFRWRARKRTSVERGSKTVPPLSVVRKHHRQAIRPGAILHRSRFENRWRSRCGSRWVCRRGSKRSKEIWAIGDEAPLFEAKDRRGKRKATKNDAAARNPDTCPRLPLPFLRPFFDPSSTLPLTTLEIPGPAFGHRANPLEMILGAAQTALFCEFSIGSLANRFRQALTHGGADRTHRRRGRACDLRGQCLRPGAHIRDIDLFIGKADTRSRPLLPFLRPFL